MKSWDKPTAGDRAIEAGLRQHARDGLTGAEIAALIGKSTSAIHGSCHRLKISLRKGVRGRKPREKEKKKNKSFSAEKAVAERNARVLSRRRKYEAVPRCMWHGCTSGAPYGPYCPVHREAARNAR